MCAPSFRSGGIGAFITSWSVSTASSPRNSRRPAMHSQKHDGHREDVALHGADAPLVDPLRRQVRELPLHLVRARDLHAVLGLRDAEVGEPPDAVAPDEDVVGADVAMDDPQVAPAVVAQLVRACSPASASRTMRTATLQSTARPAAASSLRSSESDAPST